MFREKPRVLNILLSRTTDRIKIPIDPDFRIMCEFSHGALSGDRDLQCEAARKFFFAGLPEGIDEKAAVSAMIDFYLDGLSPNRSEDKKNNGEAPSPSFDFKEDEGYFYAAFLEHYGINLNAASLHWFDFCALFRGLPDECRLKRIIDIRSVRLGDIKSGVQKSHYRKLKGIFALKLGKKRYATVAERDAAMLSDFHRRMEEIRKAVENGI